MLSEKEVSEIREHLDKAQNPIFLYDNDADGLCSYLLLRRYLGRGKGVVVKSYPGINETYAKKVQELNADYVFILDKPVASKEFIEEMREINIPIVWIDHHDVEYPKDIAVYNPLFSLEKSNEPVSFLCYEIIGGKEEELWLAVVGCIADGFFPKIAKKFGEKNPELWGEVNSAFDVFYKTEIGRVARILNFALKDSTTNIVRMIKFLTDVKNPSEVLDENEKNKFMYHRFNQINQKYQKLLEKADKIKGNPLIFKYFGELSLSADLSNELKYNHPERMVIVAYTRGVKINISVRGENARKFTLTAIEGLENATGGGHEVACGASIKSDDLDKFIENFKGVMKE